MFSARIARQVDISAFLFALNGFLAQNCRDDTLSRRASIVIEELVLNAFQHGAAESAGGVGVELAVEPPGLRGSIWHDGAPFDPAAPPVEADAASARADGRTPGCGVRLAQAFTRSLVHERLGDRTVLRFEIAPA